MAPSLTTRQLRAINALMTTSTVEAAAKASGVHRSTLFRWLRNESFCDELRRTSDAAIAGTARRLATLSGKAADVLDDLLENAQKEEVKLRAADVVLSHMLHVHELSDIENRLRQLEDAGHMGDTPGEDCEETIEQAGSPGEEGGAEPADQAVNDSAHTGGS